MKTPRKKVWLIRGLLLLACLLCGCAGKKKAGDSGTNGAGVKKEPVVVGVSQVGSESVWRTANTESVQKTFSGDDYFLIFKNARQKQENQIKALRSFISLQVDYIVFSPITESGWDTVLQEAKDAGIPVILMDRKIEVADESLYTSWVGSDFYEEGRSAGKYLVQCLKDEGKTGRQINIVVLRGTKGASATNGRSRGFEAIVKEHPEWNILEQADADFTTAKAQEEMQRLLREYDDIDVVVSQNDDMTFGAVKAIQAAGKHVGRNGDISVISFDGGKRALRMVQQGLIDVEVECNPLQGPVIEEVIRKLENSEPVDREYYTKEQVFTFRNVNEYIKDRKY